MKKILNKISKQTLFFISLIGIVVVSFTMLTTFAYQTLQTEYTSDSKKGLTVNAGVLDVTFTVNNRISESNLQMLDDYKTASYTEFTIENTKSSENAAYLIGLVDLEYSENLKNEDFKYTLATVSNGKVNVFEEGDFSNLTSSEFNLSDYKSISINTKEIIRLYLWIKNSNENQTNLKNATFKGKIQIKSVFESEVTNFKQVIIANAKSGKNGTTYSKTPLTNPAEEINGENESTLSVSNDEYGESYYFRGNVTDNYIDFAGMCWRIVRIMGDGSFKLLLEDQNNECSSTTTGDWGIPTTEGGSINRGHYGYKLYKAGEYLSSDGSSSNTETIDVADYANPNDRLDKAMVTAFENFQTSKLNDYLSLLKSGDWCVGDTPYARSGTPGSYSFTKLSRAEESDYIAKLEMVTYSAYTRLLSGNVAGFNPSFLCDGTKVEKYSDGINMYVATITADEAVFAGTKYSTENYNYYIVDDYLKTDSKSFWTLTPFTFSKNTKMSMSIIIQENGMWAGNGVWNPYPWFRPAIVLKYNVRYASGDGTKINAYKVN